MYLEAQQLGVPCVVNPERQAKLDPDLRMFLNYEIFFFSDKEARQKFEKDPLAYCGLLTDPVTQKRFQPTKASPRWTFKDRRYYFASDSTLRVFKTMPDSLALRKGM